MRELWTVSFRTESERFPPTRKSYSLILLVMCRETDEQTDVERSRNIACGFSVCPMQETTIFALGCISSGNLIGIAATEPNEAR